MVRSATEYGYKFASNNPWDNTNWGFSRVALPNDVAPGESVTFAFNATAPTTPGTYNFQWQMLREGIAAFGAASTNVAVSVNGVNDSSFISQTVPDVMGTSQGSAVSVTLRNTGTTTWTPGSYFLGSENPEANTIWGLNRAELAAPVAPGEFVTVNFNITSPAAVGAYNFQWRMVQNSARFGAFTENASVTVSNTDGSAFVSQGVPEVMAPGQSYPVSVTLRNTGGTTWAPGSYFLGSENPQANTTWGLNRVDLAVPVGPGANVTLAFNVTAPSTVGVYNFQWRMVNNSTRFGGFTTNFAVDVVEGQAQTLYFVHTDHLNTPRLVADAAGTTVWRWDQVEPFGNNPADEDPDANSVGFDLPLRLPGQRYDKETNLHYNYRRDYDSAIGRYIQSDPIGLRGGLNTYAYVFGNPLSYVDPLGLQAIPMPPLTPPVAGPNSGSNANIARGLNNLINKIVNFFCPASDDDYEKCVKKCRRDADNANERCYRDHKNAPAAYQECAAKVLADMEICVIDCAVKHGR